MENQNEIIIAKLSKYLFSFMKNEKFDEEKDCEMIFNDLI
jgi:hypothetical protein